MLTKFALFSAAAAGRLARKVDFDCPNDDWEPVYDETTLLQLTTDDGEAVCQPKPEAYAISCTATGIEVDIRYGLLYEAFDPETIKQSLSEEPAMIGNCFGMVPDEFDDKGYKFKVDFDQKDEAGNYCYTSVESGKRSENPEDTQTYINFIYNITGNNNAITNELGMILSSKLNFSVFCAIPETFDVSNSHEVEIPEGAHTGFQGQVSSDLIAAQFSLNKYTENWSEVDNESVVEIGASTNFKVDPAESFPADLIKYFVTECRMDGKNDQDQDMSYVINHGIDCFSPILAAGHETPHDLTFNMFAYGHSEAALESNMLKCTVQLCVGDDCYSDYYNAKESCRAGYIHRHAEESFYGLDPDHEEGSGQE